MRWSEGKLPKRGTWFARSASTLRKKAIKDMVDYWWWSTGGGPLVVEHWWWTIGGGPVNDSSGEVDVVVAAGAGVDNGYKDSYVWSNQDAGNGPTDGRTHPPSHMINNK